MPESGGLRFGRRLWAFVGLTALLAYAAWIGAPYLRSVVVRDAAVTTWIDVVASPISGRVDVNPLHPGTRVGADKRVATIENPLVDATPLARAEADLERAKARVTALQDFGDKLQASARQAGAANGTASLIQQLELELDRTWLELANAKAEVDGTAKIAAAAKAAYDSARFAVIEAPAGALVWSLIASPDANVQPGTPIMSWINCSIMLVDVPVSDVELALLRTGALANVVIEGERQLRHGTVFLTRGAAATIGADDLAALAKGRQPGLGQVLVKLDPSPADIEACPVGAAAYVDFPEIGIVDIVRARLRL